MRLPTYLENISACCQVLPDLVTTPFFVSQVLFLCHIVSFSQSPDCCVIRFLLGQVPIVCGSEEVDDLDEVLNESILDSIMGKRRAAEAVQKKTRKRRRGDDDDDDDEADSR